MKRHVHIPTGYGAVDFRGPQARKVTALCEELLRKQLERLERKGKPAAETRCAGRPGVARRLSGSIPFSRQAHTRKGREKGFAVSGPTFFPCWLTMESSRRCADILLTVTYGETKGLLWLTSGLVAGQIRRTSEAPPMVSATAASRASRTTPAEPARKPSYDAAKQRSEATLLSQEILDAWIRCRDAVRSGCKATLRQMHINAKQWDAEISYPKLQKDLQLLRSYFPSPAKIDPEAIDPVVVPVHPRTLEERLFKIARGYWSMPYSKGYGRRLRFLVIDRSIDALIGIIGLQSPSADMACRDSYINVEKDIKLQVVNNTLDAYTVGATPAYAPLLAGKLVAGLLHSPVIRQEYWRTYAGRKTTQLKRSIPQPLLAITTASAFGRSSIYSRLKFEDQLLARPLGYTKGYGTLHLERLYPRMAAWLMAEGLHVPAGFGHGPRVRWQNIIHTLQALNLPSRYLEHGVRREVFIFELATNFLDACRKGETPAMSQFSDDAWSTYWKKRWCLARAERMPDWFHFDAYRQIEQALSFTSI